MALDERSYETILAGAPQSQMQMQHAICNGEHTLVLTGELDIASSPALNSALTHICMNGAKAIVLDLRKLTFLDSTGIRAVLVTQAMCAEHDCEFRLVPGQAQVQRVFALCGLLDRLTFGEVAEEIVEPWGAVAPER